MKITMKRAIVKLCKYLGKLCPALLKIMCKLCTPFTQLFITLLVHKIIFKLIKIYNSKNYYQNNHIN